MSGTVQRRTEKALTKLYEALLRLSQTLISIRSSQGLFNCSPAPIKPSEKVASEDV
jgi:hypothetical protein